MVEDAKVERRRAVEILGVEVGTVHDELGKHIFRPLPCRVRERRIAQPVAAVDIDTTAPEHVAQLGSVGRDVLTLGGVVARRQEDLALALRVRDDAVHSGVGCRLDQLWPLRRMSLPCRCAHSGIGQEVSKASILLPQQLGLAARCLHLRVRRACVGRRRTTRGGATSHDQPTQRATLGS